MQGFNMGRYIPPDLEGVAPFNRNSKAQRKTRGSGGGQIVRFEMPFAVWCDHCSTSTSVSSAPYSNKPNPTMTPSDSPQTNPLDPTKAVIIGQGVRFNAEKRLIGHHHSTPIYLFRMRHADCGGLLEIRTDPANTAYVVVSGGRKRADRLPSSPHPSADTEIQLLADEERAKLRANAFANLERTIGDRERLLAAGQRIEELAEANRRAWEDPYEMNRRLRSEFRKGRHEREAEGRTNVMLQDKLSFGYELVEESELDRRRAELVDFVRGEEKQGRDKVMSRPMFESGSSNDGKSGKSGESGDTGSSNQPRRSDKEETRDRGKDKQKTKKNKKKKLLKRETTAAQMRENLVSEIAGSKRAAEDPFLTSTTSGPARMPGLKRRMIDKNEGGEVLSRHVTAKSHPPPETALPTGTIALVSYGSDSE